MRDRPLLDKRQSCKSGINLTPRKKPNTLSNRNADRSKNSMMAPRFAHFARFRNSRQATDSIFAKEKVAVQGNAHGCAFASSLALFLVVLPWLVFCCSRAAAEAEHRPETQRFVLQQTVRRVRVDVVVTDAQGQPVAGLLGRRFSCRRRWQAAIDPPVRMAYRGERAALRFRSVRYCLRTRS